jgi:shikimate kinase
VLPNLILIGFMGCGKSSVGRRLAALTGHRFVDTDEMVVQSEGQAISEIFAAKGEDYFRDAEERTLGNLVGVCGIVLSTGGGAILRESNRTLLKKIGIVAWLDKDPDLLFERASRSGKRPLLQTGDPRASFDQLLNSRLPLYKEAADIRLDVGAMSIEEVSQALLDKALRHHHML